jgi:uncharacterized protein YndB with AHSA1/START domain
MTERSVTHATFVVERFYEASPNRVFRAFEDPEAHDRWFVQGEGWEVAEYTHDFRVGGREGGRFSPTGDPVVYSNQAEYHDIVPDERIVSTYSMARDGVTMSVSLATIEFRAEGSGARLIYTEQGAYLDGIDQPTMREQGMNWLFDALAKELQREPAGA